jgi:hypothetical protein
MNIRLTRVFLPTDKTDEFTNKIEVKQRELEPWAAKISEKKSAIDVAESERKVLATKASAMEQGLAQAKVDLANLTANEAGKVSPACFFYDLSRVLTRGDPMTSARSTPHCKKSGIS